MTSLMAVARSGRTGTLVATVCVLLTACVSSPNLDTGMVVAEEAPESADLGREPTELPSAPSTDSFPPGDSATLDALWLRCEDGDFAACDDLYLESPAGSIYLEFGDTCGYRNDPSGFCEELYGGPARSAAYGDYGSDSFLDRLWDECEAGDFISCDDLYDESPVGSEYEYFGDTCGYRNDPSDYCEALYW